LQVVGGQSVQGAMLVYPRGSCGNTTCHLFAHLMVCWLSLKQVWSRCLAAREPSCLLSVTWRGEALYGWGFRVSEFWFFWCFFSAKCGFSISAKFLIYGAHTVCFCPLVVILNPPTWVF
jgi:hypothetical protein